jgi:hypothetical protein
MKYYWNAASTGHRHVIKSALKGHVSDQDLWDMNHEQLWDELEPRVRPLLSTITIRKDGEFTFYDVDLAKLELIQK